RHSLGLSDEAQQIEDAVRKVLAQGHRTADLVPRGNASIGTEAMTLKVLENL
ncbi:MAG: isocitrate/isopropylmalate family dehydrogenase, partial [Planctomycetota bacterium]